MRMYNNLEEKKDMLTGFAVISLLVGGVLAKTGMMLGWEWAGKAFFPMSGVVFVLLLAIVTVRKDRLEARRGTNVGVKPSMVAEVFKQAIRIVVYTVLIIGVLTLVLWYLSQPNGGHSGASW
jgi:hypothetical protein